MIIKKYDDHWIATNPNDVVTYLKAYTKDRHPIGTVDIAKCTCGGEGFLLEYLSQSQAIRLICPKCQRIKYLLDSQAHWDDGQHHELFYCDCNNDLANVGAGLSQQETGESHIWVGTRCTNCGTTKLFHDWQIDNHQSNE